MGETVRLRLGDVLVAKGLLDERQVEVALNEQGRAHRPLGEILVSLGFVRTEHIAELLADELGIPFVASTDAGIPGIFHHELPLALKVFSQIAQLSPEETLRCATSNAARALGLDGRTGALLPGFAADIVLVDGNPLTDLAALTSPVGVWTRGRNVLAP